ncbi:MAG: hypothetical protein HYZ53_29260 [Planctomycetes bacterium]|nr:hypothetical protein [Planctomycetota bacterium]
MDTNAPSIDLDGIRIASPCKVSWASMTGDDRTRFCQQCRLNVYNLEGMTRDEARTLIEKREGRLCVRFFRRADGTILFRDCPVGLRAIRRRLALLGGAVAAALSCLVGAVAGLRGGGWPLGGQRAGARRPLNTGYRAGGCEIDPSSAPASVPAPSPGASAKAPAEPTLGYMGDYAEPAPKK